LAPFLVSEGWPGHLDVHSEILEADVEPGLARLGAIVEAAPEIVFEIAVEGSTARGGVLVASSADVALAGFPVATVVDRFTDADGVPAAAGPAGDAALVGPRTAAFIDTLTPTIAAPAVGPPPAPVDKVAEPVTTTGIGVVAGGSIGSTGVLVVAASLADVVLGGSAAEMVVDRFTGTGATPIGGTLRSTIESVVDTPAAIVFGIVEILTGSAEIGVGSVVGTEPVAPAPVDVVEPVGSPVAMPPGVPPVPAVGAPVVGTVEPGVVAADGARRAGARSGDELVADRRTVARG
jgi:hypothetical protein